VLQEAEASRTYRHSAHEGGKDGSPVHSRRYSQATSLALICIRGCVDPRATVRQERMSQLTFPIAPPGIKLATLRLEMLCLNQLHQNLSHLNGVNEAFG
jgi:hypothetical protein